MYLLQDDYDRALYFTGYFEQSFLMVGDLKLCLIYLFNFCMVPEKKSSLESVTECRTSGVIFVKGKFVISSIMH